MVPNPGFRHAGKMVPRSAVETAVGLTVVGDVANPVHGVLEQGGGENQDAGLRIDEWDDVQAGEIRGVEAPWTGLGVASQWYGVTARKSFEAFAATVGHRGNGLDFGSGA
jgi:hypothetical protein